VIGRLCFFYGGAVRYGSGGKEGLCPHKSPFFPSSASKSLDYRKISAVGKRKRNATRSAMCNICFFCSEGWEGSWREWRLDRGRGWVWITPRSEKEFPLRESLGSGRSTYQNLVTNLHCGFQFQSRADLSSTAFTKELRRGEFPDHDRSFSLYKPRKNSKGL
jgi:hypothetical protein